LSLSLQANPQQEGSKGVTKLKREYRTFERLRMDKLGLIVLRKRVEGQGAVGQKSQLGGKQGIKGLQGK